MKSTQLSPEQDNAILVCVHELTLTLSASISGVGLQGAQVQASQVSHKLLVSYHWAVDECHGSWGAFMELDREDEGIPCLLWPEKRRIGQCEPVSNLSTANCNEWHGFSRRPCPGPIRSRRYIFRGSGRFFLPSAASAPPKALAKPSHVLRQETTRSHPANHRLLLYTAHL